MKLSSSLVGVSTLAAALFAAWPVAADWIEIDSVPSAPGDLLVDATTAAKIGADGVVVFARDGATWAAEATIAPPFPGVRGALDADRLLVAGSGSGDELAALHRGPTGWIEEPLLPLTAWPIGALAIDGDYAAIGAPGDDVSGAPDGAVYVLRRVGPAWTPMQTVVPTAPTGDDAFGYALALSGTRLAVCAENEAVPLVGGGGSVHVFDLVDGLWEETGTVADPSTCGSFCRQLGWLDANTLLVNDGCILHTFNFDGHLWSEDAGYVAAMGPLADFALGGSRVTVAEPAGSRVRLLRRAGEAWVEDTSVQQADQVGLDVGYAPGWLLSTGLDGRLRFFAEIGAPCDDAAACPLGSCVDGRCCDGTCAASCEACGADGRCGWIAGEPRPGHPACASVCDGATTAHGGTCDGTQPECVPDARDCAAFRCADGRCLTTCASRDDCAPGYACVASACVPGEPTCVDAETSQLVDGSRTACAPYRCAALGVCGSGCATTADCVDGFVCSSSGSCVTSPLEEGRDGCGCATPGRRPPPRGWGLTALALGAALRVSAARRRARPRA